MLVHDAWCLFQNAPSQFTYVRFTMKSGSNRLPRRAGLCVLLHADQLLIVSISPRSERWISRWIRRDWLEDMHLWRWWSFRIWCQRDRGSSWWSIGDRITSCDTVVIDGIFHMSPQRCRCINSGMSGSSDRCCIAI